jgi:uncharacterized SAM-binding protein YcdF (DUF218 family)
MRLRRAIGVGFLLLCGAAGALAFSALLFVISRFPGTAELPVDCGIVFGAAVQPLFDEERRVIGSQAGPGIARRVGTAALLYRIGLIHRLVFTGGTGEGMRQSEGDVMRALALAKGVKIEDTKTETASHSTGESLRNSRPLLSDCASVAAISDRYHLARIEFLARQMGWTDLRTYPASPHAQFAFEAWSVTREVGAILYYSMHE